MKVKIPTHIVLLPDGNRRWARQRGWSTLKGHQEGYKNITRFCKWCKNRGVKVLTAFGFSTENWNRPKEEVKYLMKLLEKELRQAIKKYKKSPEGVKVKIIGQKEKLPKSLQKVIKKIEELTKNNKKFQLNLAISYGGRWDIAQAIKKIIKRKIPAKKITEELVDNYLSTAKFPPPDLIIRTGGEKRLSNFLLWQAAYAELFFIDKMWPDFTEKDLDKILKEYIRRHRRFGR